MAAQTLDQVISSLGSIYQPQIDAVNNQEAALPAQYAAQQQGLDATQQQAFGDILNSARARGTGVAFGGIPLGEQAQYTASTYLPAVANLKTAQTTQQQSLANQINAINEDKFNAANNLYQFGVTSDQNQQQINATNAETAAFNPTTTPSSSTPTTTVATTPTTNPLTIPNLTGGKSQQDAYNAVQALLKTNNPSVITQTFKAIQASANYGNTYDQAKIQAINSLPAFKQYLANANNASF